MKPVRQWDRKTLAAAGVALMVLLLLVISVMLRGGGETGPGGQSTRPPVGTPVIGSMDELAGYLDGRGLPSADPSRSVPPYKRSAPLEPGDHVRGDPNARVMMIAYYNLENPYLPLLHPAIVALIAKRPADLALAVRHLPVTDDDWILAQGSECIADMEGEQAFHAFLDVVAQTKNPGRDTATAFAREIGIEDRDIVECLTLPGSPGLIPGSAMNAAERVANDVLGAQTGNFVGSPSFVFENQRARDQRFVDGAVTDEFMEALLDGMLRGDGRI